MACRGGTYRRLHERSGVHQRRRCSLGRQGPRLGGLTHSFLRRGVWVDNGQHVFLRCCTAYRGLLERLGVADLVHLQDRLDIAVRSGRTAGTARLRRSGLPAPLHLGGSLARYRWLPPADRVRAMWTALADGRVSYVSSDHAPSTLAQKQSGSIWEVHFGLPGVDTTFATLLEGAAAGRISYERVVEVYSEQPARVYGLWPRKGRLAPGADADIVVVDPSSRRRAGLRLRAAR